MTSVRGYPAYRAVDARWLKSIPSSWDVVRLRYLCDITTGSGDTQDADPDGEYPFVVRSPTPLRSSEYSFDTEAILTAGDGALVGRAFLHLNGKFHAHQRVYVLTNFKHVDTRFLYYYFSSLFWLMTSDGSAKTTVDSVRRWMLADMPVAVPPTAEQRVIADFLDRETAQLDALVAKQDELIGVLQERRAGVLFTLNSIEGSNTRLRRLFRPSDESSHPNEEVLSVYRDYGVVPKSSRSDNFNKTPENLDRYLYVRLGDLVVNRMKAWQGSLGISSHQGIVSGDYEVLRPIGEQLDPEFAHHLLRSPRMIGEYRVRSTGIRPAQWRLYWDQMGNISIPVPPKRVQRELVDRIQTQLDGIDSLIAKTRNHIEFTEERRAALISAAVTGQIDVTARS